MAASEEEWIRHRAYELWEQEGYPSGKDQEHWERAKLEYASQKPIASPKASPKGSKLKPPAADTSKPIAKTTAAKPDKKAKTASKAASSKASPAKPAPAAKAGAKPKISAVAASATPEQTKKRPKKIAAE